jgi:hypothetical protein
LANRRRLNAVSPRAKSRHLVATVAVLAASIGDEVGVHTPVIDGLIAIACALLTRSKSEDEMAVSPHRRFDKGTERRVRGML